MYIHCNCSHEWRNTLWLTARLRIQSGVQRGEWPAHRSWRHMRGSWWRARCWGEGWGRRVQSSPDSAGLNTGPLTHWPHESQLSSDSFICIYLLNRELFPFNGNGQQEIWGSQDSPASWSQTVEGAAGGGRGQAPAGSTWAQEEGAGGGLAAPHVSPSGPSQSYSGLWSWE